jgi:hypothetical protein
MTTFDHDPEEPRRSSPKLVPGAAKPQSRGGDDLGNAEELGQEAPPPARSTALWGVVLLTALSAGLIAMGALGLGRTPSRQVSGSELDGPTKDGAIAANSPDGTLVTGTLSISLSNAVAAHAATDTIEIYEAPEASTPIATLPRLNEHGVVNVFSVKEFRPGWIRVALPTPPNGSQGWLRLRDVDLYAVPYEIKVHLASKRLEVWNRGHLELSFPIGIGKKSTPTPGGDYYIKELLRPTDPSGPWGTYAYGLNGFSNSITLEEGKPGVIGIHGTNDPSSVGMEVSNGCIRLRNGDIERLVPVIPLGTPVTISAD